MTDEIFETWSASEMSEVRTRPAVSGGRLFYTPALQPPERRGQKEYPDESTAPAVSWCQQTISDVGRRLSDRYAGAVPCTQWYARTHNRNWIRSAGRATIEAPWQ